MSLTLDTTVSLETYPLYSRVSRYQKEKMYADFGSKFVGKMS